MSNVLYDEPGPKARRRAAIGTVVAAAILLGLTGVAVWRLADRGQFDAELWSPLINPGDDNFVLVWRLLGKGLLATLTAAVLAISLSLVIGTLLGVARMMLGKGGRIPVVAAIELFRGLPVIISIFYVYILIRSTGIDISFLPGSDGLWFLVIGLTLYNSVIIAEIVRAGVNSLPRGQSEAALAIGMTRWKSMKNVELPQAFRTMLPALISQLVVILKDTSLVAVLGLYTELLRRGNIISLNLDNPIQVLFVVGVIFIVINYGLSKLAEFVERRLSTRGQSSGVRLETGAAAA
ncbi:glutamate ABC transporter permease [Nocardioides flavus (ex Wang et al. 2016)]|uniref:Glutamate ABC transporter permease n=1 Tax=Nocardioides flavus (ex Wang et al. 2016) TaxID=2058780 RepID=A0ABQ3HNY3_9ACTN|nr:amino acid ABC transporter permease [Nocardioides flavus (ex Wang et al. 2016)]GHE19241.1 glutamate ABC transporter permease [Nocardioides flavus (ex Wang et al. 2016)]